MELQKEIDFANEKDNEEVLEELMIKKQRLTEEMDGLENEQFTVS